MAKKKFAQVVRGNACFLPFKNGVFDFAVLTEVLQVLEMPYKALREAKRVLKRDGAVLITVPNITGPAFGWLSKNPYVIVGFSHEILANGLRKLGFRIVECFSDKVTLSYPRRLLKILGINPGKPYFLSKSLSKIFPKLGDHVCIMAKKLQVNEKIHD